jgi:hypothetical protein
LFDVVIGGEFCEVLLVGRGVDGGGDDLVGESHDGLEQWEGSAGTQWLIIITTTREKEKRQKRQERRGK